MIKSIIFNFGNVFIEWNSNLDGGATLADNARAMCEKYPEHARFITRHHARWRKSPASVNLESGKLGTATIQFQTAAQVCNELESRGILS